MSAASADLVFVNGSVLTVDPVFTVASALAVTGGLVSAVGDRAQVMAQAGPGTRVIDLRGGTLLPGINDTHLHACSFGLTRPPLALDLAGPAVRSLADAAEAVRTATLRTPAGGWITGHGWDLSRLRECAADPARLPTRYDLDPVAPGHPVVLFSGCGRAAWANSAALRRAGIDRNTPAPPGSGLLTDEAGEPTGLLRDDARAAVERALPPLTPRLRADAIRAALGTLARLGITSFTEPALGPGGDTLMRGALATATLDTYRRLLVDGELTARVSVLLLPAGRAGTAAEFIRILDGTELPRTPDFRRLDVIGVNIFAGGDGPDGPPPAHERCPAGGPGPLPAGATGAERAAGVAEMIRHAHAAGYQAAVHVTGDHDLDTVVDAFAAADAAHSRPEARHYVLPGDRLTARGLKRLAEAGLGIGLNPTAAWTAAGRQEVAPGWFCPDAGDAGVTVISGSDAPAAFPDWRQGLAAMLRCGPGAGGRPGGPEHRDRLEAALRTYTTDAAWQDFAEDWKGSLEVGKAADLCVLGGDLLGADPDRITGLPVLFTAVGGAVVHDELSV
ncbi:amidohydrolase [Streptomyces pactum]|uniref:amidohydrolase n=1 Tax=Streptomyces pactum TaxID=68249 RepID=UPI0036F5E2AA